MGYYDSPNADRSSVNCELSERKLMNLLNRESGFICRNDIPDYGCDFDVELILNGKDVSDWRFPVQLKSVQRIKLVKHGTLLAYSMETSRIAYLMKRKPAMGLIILYDISTENFYYDYVDRIYGRITEKREASDWKQKKMVTIHIPTTNYLTDRTVKEIHQTFTTRFESGELMQRSYGSIFGLPDMGTMSGYTDDLNSIVGIQQFIITHGLSLLRNLGLDNILTLIKQLPNKVIYKDKTLLLIAAITYAGTERIIEASSCCQKIDKGQLNAEESFIYQYTALIVQLYLGYIDERNFLREFKKIDQSGLNEEQKLLYIIMEASFKLTGKGIEVDHECMLQEIEMIFIAIESANFDKNTKSWYALLNAENVILLLNYMQDNLLFSNIEEIGVFDKINRYINTIALCNEKILSIQDVDGQNSDKFVLAISYLTEAHLFITTHKYIFCAEFPYSTESNDNLNVDFIQLVTKIMENLAIASSLFYEENRIREQYKCFCFLIETIELVKNGYGCDFIEDSYLSMLYETKTEIEIENELLPHNLIFQRLVNSKKDFGLIKKGKGIPFIKELSNREIEELATNMYLSLKLSPLALPNLISALKSFKTFHQRCNDENILIFSLNDAIERSIEVPQFILRDQQTGIEKGPSTDINELLRACGL